MYRFKLNADNYMNNKSILEIQIYIFKQSHSLLQLSNSLKTPFFLSNLCFAVIFFFSLSLFSLFQCQKLIRKVIFPGSWYHILSAFQPGTTRNTLKIEKVVLLLSAVRKNVQLAEPWNSAVRGCQQTKSICFS